MTMVVSIADDEAPGWREVLLILAIDRWQPLLADLGVPAAIATIPAAVHAAAAHCLQIKLALHDVRSQGREDHRLMIEEMVRDFLARVVSDYSEALAIELHCWALRQYVDDLQRNSYLLWSQLLRRLAGVAGLGSPLVPLSFPTDTIASMTHAVETHLSLYLERDDLERIAAVAIAPVSALEHLVAAREPDLLESVRESLPEAMTNQRAYHALAQIVSDLDAGARGDFLVWARQQATAMQMPSQLVVLPTS